MPQTVDAESVTAHVRPSPSELERDIGAQIGNDPLDVITPHHGIGRTGIIGITPPRPRRDIQPVKQRQRANDLVERIKADAAAFKERIKRHRIGTPRFVAVIANAACALVKSRSGSDPNAIHGPLDFGQSVHFSEKVIQLRPRERRHGIILTALCQINDGVRLPVLAKFVIKEIIVDGDVALPVQIHRQAQIIREELLVLPLAKIPVGWQRFTCRNVVAVARVVIINVVATQGPNRATRAREPDRARVCSYGAQSDRRDKYPHGSPATGNAVVPGRRSRSSLGR